MIRKECQSISNDIRVKVAGEHGRSAIFLNKSKDTFVKIRVDGCVISNSTGQKSADWIVSRPGVGDVIVELKGKNVEYAIQQINCTAKFWTNENLRAGRLAALIVAKQCPPLTSTTIQKAQTAFAREYEGRLRVVTRNDEFSFDTLLQINTSTNCNKKRSGRKS
ncbi:hypothetical protein [Methylosinus sporium]|uniref:hypothetical protein n=1 Tax=Methylosinus sporium TaxID=428 RepID=UPI00383B712C